MLAEESTKNRAISTASRTSLRVVKLFEPFFDIKNAS
jgi:hypothetical protein